MGCLVLAKSDCGVVVTVTGVLAKQPDKTKHTKTQKARGKNETKQARKASACTADSCWYLRLYMVDNHGLLVD
jgi:hypothetical protein